MDNVTEKSESDPEEEKFAEDVAPELEIPVPDIIHSTALEYSVFVAIYAAGIVLTIVFVEQFIKFDNDTSQGFQLPEASVLLTASIIGLIAGFVHYIGYVAGVQDGDKFGVVAEDWRKKAEELQQYRHSEEFQQKIAEAERKAREEFKKSDMWSVTKIWVGFCALMLVLIFAIGIFQ